MKKIFLLLLVLGITLPGIAQDSGDLDNQFYFRFGYSKPAKGYIGAQDSDLWDYFSRHGGTFELGHIFMFNKAALADGLRPGLNVDWLELSYNQLTETDPGADFAIGMLKVASKIGPSLTYSPVKLVAFDVFVKAKFSWVGGLAIWDLGEVDEVFLDGTTLGVATGLNVRLAFLMLGFEYNYDSMKFESQDFPGEYFGNLADDSDKTPMPSFTFSVGFSF